MSLPFVAAGGLCWSSSFIWWWVYYIYIYIYICRGPYRAVVCQLAFGVGAGRAQRARRAAPIIITHGAVVRTLCVYIYIYIYPEPAAAAAAAAEGGAKDNRGAAQRITYMCVCVCVCKCAVARMPIPKVIIIIYLYILYTLYRPQVERQYPPNLSILISGGKETNRDSLSSGERSGRSPSSESGRAPSPCPELWSHGKASLSAVAGRAKVPWKRAPGRVTAPSIGPASRPSRLRCCTCPRVGLFGNAALSGW